MKNLIGIWKTILFAIAMKAIMIVINKFANFAHGDANNVLVLNSANSAILKIIFNLTKLIIKRVYVNQDIIIVVGQFASNAIYLLVLNVVIKKLVLIVTKDLILKMVYVNAQMKSMPMEINAKIAKVHAYYVKVRTNAKVA